MKIAFVSDNSFGPDSKRRRLLLERYGYFTVKRNCVYSILKYRPTHVYIEDDISICDLIKILCLLKVGLIKRLVLRSLELYRIDYTALKSEFNFYFPRKNDLFGKFNYLFRKFLLLRRVAKIFLFKKLLHDSNSILVLPSELRKQYMLDIGLCKEILVLRNLPLEEDMQSENVPEWKCSEDLLRIVQSGRFYLLSGRLNARSDISVFLNHCKLKGDILLVAGIDKDEGELLEKEYRGVVISLGFLSHEVIIYLIKNSRGGVILYNNNTINQIFSASGKLFEYVFFCKPVFVSSNAGVKKELDQMEYPYFEISDGAIINRGYSYNNCTEYGSCSFNRELEDKNLSITNVL